MGGWWIRKAVFENHKEKLQYKWRKVYITVGNFFVRTLYCNWSLAFLARFLEISAQVKDQILINGRWIFMQMDSEGQERFVSLNFAKTVANNVANILELEQLLQINWSFSDELTVKA